MILTGQSVCMRSLLCPVSLRVGSRSLLLETTGISVRVVAENRFSSKMLCLWLVTPQSYLASSLGDGMNPITGVVSIHPKHVLLARPRQFPPAVLTKRKKENIFSKQRDRHPHSFLCVLQSWHPESRHGDKTRTAGPRETWPVSLFCHHHSLFNLFLCNSLDYLINLLRYTYCIYVRHIYLDFCYCKHCKVSVWNVK